MPSVSSLECLKTVNMTETVLRMEMPYQFLKRYLFSDERPQDKEDIEIGEVARVRRMAPFVREGAAALMTKGRSRALTTIAFPNIRIKKPFNPNEVYFDRFVGSRNEDPFNAPMVAARMQERLTENLEDMESNIQTSEEFLAAMACQGVVTYSVAGQDSFTVDFQKPADVDYSATEPWTTGTTKIWFHFYRARKLLSERSGGGYQLTDAIMGEEAGEAFMQNADVFANLNREQGIGLGADLDFARELEEEGSVQYLGTFMRVRCWVYTAQITLPDFSTVSLVPPKEVLFVSRTRKAENVMYYGGITDPRALEVFGTPRMKRFSKSWQDEDPGSIYTLLQSRPLAVPRRADSMQNFIVVA